MLRAKASVAKSSASGGPPAHGNQRLRSFLRRSGRGGAAKPGLRAGILQLAAGHSCRAVQWYLSLLFALACLLRLLWATVAGGAQLVAGLVARLARQLDAQAAWDALAH